MWYRKESIEALDGVQRFTIAAYNAGIVAVDYKWNLRGLDKKSQEYKLAIEQVHARASKRLLAVCKYVALSYICSIVLLSSIRGSML